MRIFNKEKDKELSSVDLEKGYLKNDTLIVHHNEVKGKSVKQLLKNIEPNNIRQLGDKYFKILKRYPNGGEEVEQILPIETIPTYDEEEPIQVYIEYAEEELLNIKVSNIRQRREVECFSVINRGQLWYDGLSEIQKDELKSWYQKWLDATETLIIPETPEWIK